MGLTLSTKRTLKSTTPLKLVSLYFSEVKSYSTTDGTRKIFRLHKFILGLFCYCVLSKRFVYKSILV